MVDRTHTGCRGLYIMMYLMWGMIFSMISDVIFTTWIVKFSEITFLNLSKFKHFSLYGRFGPL